MQPGGFAMSVDLARVHAEAAAAFAERATGIGDGDWGRPTPCAEWSVRELVNHVVAGNLWTAELTRGRTIEDVGDALDGDLLGDQPVQAVERSAAIASAAFEADGVMEAPCAVSYGPVPGAVYCGHRTVDLVGHGWDLATATGQDAAINPAHVKACLEIVEPQFELLRASGMFGDAVDPGPAADPEHRLLCMLGRRNPG